MKPGRKTLIPFLTLAMVAAGLHHATASGPRRMPKSDPVGSAAVGPQAVTAPGCLLKLSAINAPIIAAGTDRDVMRAWSLITGSVRRRSAGRMLATTVHCPAPVAPELAPMGDAAPVIRPPHAANIAADGLETGLRYHFGPKTSR